MRSDYRRLFAISFAALFLELMLVRWAPAVVRLVAYYANLLLISSFLGLGLGALASRRSRGLLGWFPLLMAGDVAVLLLSRSATLPSGAGEMRFFAGGSHLLNYAILVGVFAANALLFVPFGHEIGRLFGRLPTLRAYTWDLLGSLAGTVAFGLFSFMRFSPTLGMAGVFAVVLGLLGRGRWAWAMPVLLACLVAVDRSGSSGVIWSPYYAITVRDPDRPDAPPVPPPDLRTRMDPPIYTVSVNQDFYQMHGTIDPARYTPGGRGEQLVRYLRDQYLLPYALAPGRDRVAVLGSGGGMDVEAALLSGARRVDAVDIDPRLIELARRDNASGCYDDPRVTVHVDDARAFLQRARPGYDLVVFGFLDSQALFSSMSNIRLDGFTYTVEGLRAAFGLLDDGGMLALSFAAGQPWLARKIAGMVATASERPPLVYVDGGQIIVCAFKGGGPPAPPARFGRFALTEVDRSGPRAVAPATDDWPFLYLASRSIPGDYAIVIAAVLALSLVGVLAIGRVGPGGGSAHFFFLGLGFMLLETKSIGDCSLYFGSTWLVTMLVVAGVLAMVLAANLVADRVVPSRLWYVPLFAALILLYIVPPRWVLSLDLPARLAWTLLAVPSPIFFAGLIFSSSFRGVADPGPLLGANLIGATVGGFCEYLGMATGSSALMLVVVAAYLGSALCRSPARPSAVA